MEDIEMAKEIKGEDGKTYVVKEN
jgi:hypothetical protein